MINILFNDFNKIATKTWEELIKKDLKGADYNKKLLTHTIENITLKPYYRKEDAKDIYLTNQRPGLFPFVRGNNSLLATHKIRQNILVDKFSDANKKAIYLIKIGVTSIGFDINQKDNLLKKDIFKLLKNINLQEVEINFHSGQLSLIVLKYCADYISEIYKKHDIIGCSVGFDPIGHKTVNGSFYDNSKTGYKTSLLDLFENAGKLPSFRIININAAIFRNAGSSAVQELAYGISIGNDYLSSASDLGINIEKLASKMMFTFGIGSNYFMEIAKIRAARLLWAKIIEAYGIKNFDSAKMKIYSETSDWNKTAYDPYVNILRTTTEAMSAIIGGTDSLLVKPFNSSYDNPDDFSERIARNTQIILNEEAYFDKFIDPAGGSYYIENLTNSIAQNAWNLFVDIEKEGGYNAAFDKGIIKNDIEETSAKRDMAIAQKKEVLLGTNQYPARDETIKIEKKNNKQIGANAIRIYRGAEAFEELRQKTQKADITPKVLLLKYGNLAMRKARATFAANFFACAGFEIVEKDVKGSIEDGIHLDKPLNADITVVCSSDDEYIQIALKLKAQLESNSIFVVAGYPQKQIEALKNAGITNFIHVKSNILETLSNFQNIIIKNIQS